MTVTAALTPFIDRPSAKAANHKASQLLNNH
jgi:hypothetical protein